jgi:predicted metal-dependent RNase
VYNEQGQFVDLSKADGKIASAFFGDGINPVALADAADRNFNRYSLLGNAYVEFSPIERLRIRSDYGVPLVISQAAPPSDRKSLTGSMTSSTVRSAGRVRPVSALGR